MMVEWTSLWLPMVLSAVTVFLASALIHMVLPYHKGDFAKLPNEARVLESLRKEDIPPGDYAFPRAESMKDMGSPEMTAKYEQGPVGILTLLPAGPPAMGKSLALWFVYNLVVSFFAAYLASRTLGADADYLAVFRVVGTVAFLGYAGSEAQNSIWMGRAWSTTIKNLIDGLIYGLLTAGIFGWLW